MPKQKIGDVSQNAVLNKFRQPIWDNASSDQRQDLINRHVNDASGQYLVQPHKSGLGDLAHTIGGVLKTAAPFAALIPGLSPLAAAGLAAGGSAAGGALHGDKFNLGKTLMAGAAGYGGGELLGNEGIGGIGDVASKLGNFAKQPNVLGNASGKLDFGKVAGTAMAGANMLGARQQRKSSEKYNNAQIDLRNQLMSRVLTGGAGAGFNPDFKPTF